MKVYRITGSDGTTMDVAAETFIEAIEKFEFLTGELAKEVKVKKIYEEVVYERAFEVY